MQTAHYWDHPAEEQVVEALVWGCKLIVYCNQTLQLRLDSYFLIYSFLWT